VSELELVKKEIGIPFASPCRIMKWAPPPQGLMKLNADGAVTKTLIHGAVGVMCEDENGFSWLRIRRSQALYLDATHDGAVPPRRHGQQR
jgi:hypothetical protein